MAYELDKDTIQNIVTLVAVALGWVLGEATGFIKKRSERNKIIEALRVELADCSSWLQRNKLTLEDMIRLTTLGHTSEVGPVEVLLIFIKSIFQMFPFTYLKMREFLSIRFIT